MKKISYLLVGIIALFFIAFFTKQSLEQKVTQTSTVEPAVTTVTSLSTISETTTHTIDSSESTIGNSTNEQSNQEVTTLVASTTEETTEVITAQTIKTPAIATDLLNTIMEDGEGNRTSFYHLLNKPTIINVWASWCPPCREEMPYFQSFYEEYGDQIDFIMINGIGSRPTETMEVAKSFLSESNYTFPVYYDVVNNTQAKWAINILPYTIIIEADGTTTRYPGQISQDQLQAFIDQMID